MRYVIMADGDMKRWHAQSAIPKHLLTVDGETLLSRLVRQLRRADGGAEVFITSHNPAYEVPGAVRWEPRENHLEIDRFTRELICDDVCFLYGDTCYTDGAVDFIAGKKTDALWFVGSQRSIVAVIAHDGQLLQNHVDRARDAFLAGRITDCRGWQVYQSYAGLPFGAPCTGPAFTKLTDGTCGFNTWQEYEEFLEKRGEACGRV